MRWWCLIVLVWSAGCGLPEPPPLAGSASEHEATVDGRRRQWIVFDPAQRAESPALIVALPGSSQTAAALRAATEYRFDELAVEHGLVVLYAQGWEEGGFFGLMPEWNECRATTPLPAHEEEVDDVGFVLARVDELIDSHGVDPTRVYAFGVSDGGQMAFRLATEHPERFAAIASLIAQNAHPDDSSCTDPQGPIPVLTMNGTDDPIIPFDGGQVEGFGMKIARVQSMEQTWAHWRRVNGLRGTPKVVEFPDRDPDDGSTVVRYTWRAHKDAELVGYVIQGGGHTIPGGDMGIPAFLVGNTNRDISAVDAAWAFFARHRRR